MVPVFAAGAYVLGMPARPAPRGAGGEGAMDSIISCASEKLFTSTQDNNTIMALMHVTEAMALVDAARRLADDHAIARDTGVDIGALSSKAEKHRKVLVAKLSVRSAREDEESDGED